MTSRPWSGRSLYVGLTLGIIAFTIYGSYVPFNFRYVGWDRAVEQFHKAMTDRFIPWSRSDWVANVMLGFPLGYGLLGAIRLGRPLGFTTILVGLSVIAFDVVFSASVEFGQLYFPGRTCAGSDVFAQTLGATAGVLAWIIAGERINRQIGIALGHNDPAGSAIRWLVAYAGFVTLVQWLPLDFNASPVDIYRRFKSTDHFVYIPFTDGAPWGKAKTWEQAQKWLELVALYMPLGLILSRCRLPSGMSRPAGGTYFKPDSLSKVLVFAVAFAGFTELGQITVSRRCSISDVIVATFAVGMGWGIARILSNDSKYRLERMLLLGQAWLLVLMVIHWHPFEFNPSLFGLNLKQVSWVPLDVQLSENYLLALDKVIMKFVIFAPIGLAVGYAFRWRTDWMAIAACVGITGIISSVLESGQLLLMDRFGSPTDVIFACVGGFVGMYGFGRAAGVSPSVLGMKIEPTT